MTTTADDNQRLLLLLSKDLFRRGSEAAREGSHFSHGVAVSHFHDAAEIAARTSALKVGAPIKPDTNFLDYWSKTNECCVRQNLGIQLRHHAEMGDLNEARKYSSTAAS